MTRAEKDEAVAIARKWVNEKRITVAPPLSEAVIDAYIYHRKSKMPDTEPDEPEQSDECPLCGKRPVYCRCKTSMNGFTTEAQRRGVQGKKQFRSEAA
jgi:hypothetical protein